MTDTPKALLPNAEGKVALVTGAGGGIGKAVVEQFRHAGVRVAAADIANLDPSGDGYLPLKTDCTDERQIKAAIGSVAHLYGAIDYLVHAVGQTGSGPLASVNKDEWERLLSVNLTSAFLVTREAYTRLKKPGASVILFSSTNGRNGGPPLSGPAYAAAKAGVLNLSRYLSKEWANDGVRVNCLAPGPVDSPMLGRLENGARAALRASLFGGRISTADEVAAAVCWLCSDHAATITGSCVNISGGLVLD